MFAMPLIAAFLSALLHDEEGKVLTSPRPVEMVAALPSETPLYYRERRRSLYCLMPGESVAERVLALDHGVGALPDAVWFDGRAVLWLRSSAGWELASWSPTSGDARSLTGGDGRAPDGELSPPPLGDTAVFESAGGGLGYVGYRCGEGSSDTYGIATVTRSGSELNLKLGADRHSGRLAAFDVSFARGEFYALIYTKPAKVVIHDLGSGRRLNEKSLPEGVEQIAVSPNGERMILARRSKEPDFRLFSEIPLEEQADAVMARYAGCIVVDLASWDVEVDSGVGRHFSWSPDGRRIAFLSAWGLQLMDAETGEAAEVIARKPSAREIVPLYYHPPAWSPSGDAIAAGLGRFTDNEGPAFLIIDLEGNRCFVIEGSVTQAFWGEG